MTLATDEVTVHDGAPRELYAFELSGATSRYYTSAGEDLTFQGQTYTNIPLERGPIVSEPFGDAPPLEILMPFGINLITDLLFKIPPRSASVTVYRSHSATPTVANTGIMWTGLITDVKASGRVVSISSESVMGAALSAELPMVSIQTHCNHVLYGTRCGVDRTSYDFATTVVTVSDRTVTVNSVDSKPDGTFSGGMLLRSSDGEYRTIIDQTSTTITLLRPFRALAGSDVVTLYQGCDHLRDTCYTKFNNLVNFGGHADIRQGRPHRMGIYGTGGKEGWR